MFDFVKKGLDAIAPPEPVFDDEIFEEQDVDSDTTLQYAHLFQELAELTPEGSTDNLVRKSIVDIPLDDDIELNNIEFNIGDGRVTDVPADATLQEAFYDELKSFDDFYQEAADTTPMFIRETANSHARRVSMKQEELYKVYQESMEKKGLFGFGMIKLSDDRVPQSVMFDFGPYSKSNDKHYVTKLECFFETDKNHRINKKQLEAVNAFRDASYEGIAELLKSIVGKDYPKEAKKFETKSIWDSLTPTKLYVPKDLSDEYKVSIEVTADFADDPFYITWKRSMSNKKAVAKSYDSGNKPAYNNYTTRVKAIKESYVPTPRPSRFGKTDEYYQEAIDFGDAAQTTVAPAEAGTTVNAGTDDAALSVATDTSADAPADAAPAADAGAADQPAATEEPVDLGVDKNDVSDQIVDQVASTDGDDASTADVDGDLSAAADAAADADTASEDPEAALDDLSNDATGDATDSEFSDGATDYESMTIDELLAQGTERLKSMPIDQLKTFLSEGGAAVQEAFFLTAGNINKELDEKLRKCLGILNDNKMKLDELLETFRKEGKKLNRVLSKAAKMQKVYNDDERTAIQKLNSVLVDLSKSIKANRDSNYEATIKRLISAFASQSALVAEFVEARLENANK